MTANLQKDIAPNFEATIAELELIITQMESGNLPLDQSISTYKRGAALLQACQQSLTIAEQQVRIFTEANKLAPFNPSDD